ncbi:hypothetical protein BS78_08G117500 [Paspalum vaginatum]|nr:hypothetical protein BS78_08G117500 [Paspalum vaginatum]
MLGGSDQVLAQVVFKSKLDAVEAFGDLHGRNIYDGCCQMVINWGSSLECLDSPDMSCHATMPSSKMLQASVTSTMAKECVSEAVFATAAAPATLLSTLTTDAPTRMSIPLEVHSTCFSANSSEEYLLEASPCGEHVVAANLTCCNTSVPIEPVFAMSASNIGTMTSSPSALLMAVTDTSVDSASTPCLSAIPSNVAVEVPTVSALTSVNKLLAAPTSLISLLFSIVAAPVPNASPSSPNAASACYKADFSSQINKCCYLQSMQSRYNNNIIRAHLIGIVPMCLAPNVHDEHKVFRRVNDMIQHYFCLCLGRLLTKEHGHHLSN